MTTRHAILIALAGLSACSGSASDSPPAFKVRETAQVFEVMWRTNLIGSAAAPLNHIENFSVSRDRILVTNGRLNRIQLYDIKGDLLLVMGDRGRGEASFDRPAGAFIDARGNYYINDTANERIQVLDANGGFVRALASGGFTSQIYVLDQVEHPTLVSIGQYVYGNKVFVVRRTVLETKSNEYYLERPHPKLILNNSTCVTDSGILYVCNMLLPTLYTVDTRRGSTRTFMLNSPSMEEFFDLNWAPENPRFREGQLGMQSIFATKSFLAVYNLVWFSEKLLVTLRRINPASTDSLYVIDSYDKVGNCVFYGLEVNSPLVASNKEYVFVSASLDSLEFGGLQISALKFNQTDIEVFGLGVDR